MNEEDAEASELAQKQLEEHRQIREENDAFHREFQEWLKDWAHGGLSEKE